MTNSEDKIDNLLQVMYFTFSEYLKLYYNHIY